ncbi:Na+/H+ antiporter subunit D [Geodermatophilus sp. YIM 151500]|uniref:Na+/H+ antiporter subunit D n=1 Tax=Geodermatophilus sp. YIM 151500 TaxID=2984531 RepID=UPI0021E48C3A|nr:Na+/H+ antiporter subunit D [Geodermatophilus sp. YIM 151500]MCV2491059.1 Na+/H+ antiporter subunit D [Geodermatophilus sp. YIM 151500]
MIRVVAPLPVLLPLLGAAASLVLGRYPRAQRLLSLAVLGAVLAVSVTLLLLADADGAVAVAAGGWPVPQAIMLVVDRLSALMLVVATTVALGVLVFAVGQGVTDTAAQAPVSIFHPTFLVLVAGVGFAFLAGDLFNLYVGFEVLLTASYVLLTLGGSARRIRGGITYVVVSLLGSLLFLAAIGLVYAATGTVNMAQLSFRLAELDDGTRTMLNCLLLTAFGIKAAVFPLSAWLPDSYPTAPAPVTAVFAGLLTKVGVYAIIRTQTLLFPGAGLVDDLLLLGALATMLVGILGAVAQVDLRRLLSFTLVSHIGYMVFGVALSTVAGLAGAIFYVVHHITIQTSLFLVAGLVERKGGSTSVNRLGGLAAASPVLATLFLVPALNLAGIPPLSGFLGKLGLLQAGVEAGGVLPALLVAGSVVTSLLTLLAVSRVWTRAFWRPPAQEPEADTADASAAQEAEAARDAAGSEDTGGSDGDRPPVPAPLRDEELEQAARTGADGGDADDAEDAEDAEDAPDAGVADGIVPDGIDPDGGGDSRAPTGRAVGAARAGRRGAGVLARAGVARRYPELRAALARQAEAASAVAVREDDEADELRPDQRRPLPPVLVATTGALVAVTVALTGLAGPLYALTDRAAGDLLERVPYREAVYGEGPADSAEGVP